MATVGKLPDVLGACEWCLLEQRLLVLHWEALSLGRENLGGLAYLRLGRCRVDLSLQLLVEEELLLLLLRKEEGLLAGHAGI